ncbi:MAG TPA: hypothetical protein VMW47_12365 [Verrucomicrobiae bacterium]|nr:hypothetical protein [Verrucomicrobiae bacterium]
MTTPPPEPPGRFDLAQAEAARSQRRPAAVEARLDRVDDTVVRCGFRDESGSSTCPGILGEAQRKIEADGRVRVGRVVLPAGFRQRPDGSYGLSHSGRAQRARDRAAVGRGALTRAAVAERAAVRAWVDAIAEEVAGRSTPTARVAPPGALVECPHCERPNHVDAEGLRLFDPFPHGSGSV